MGKLNIEFMNDSLGFFSKAEDDIENKISKQLDSGFNSRNMDIDELTYLSSKRHSLFNWLSFKKSSKLLEIGGELGALTSLFAKKVSHVTVVEKKKSRAEIIKKRFNKEGNVNVINKNFSELDFQHEFDYIIVHDIIGFIKKYIKNEDPYKEFLRIVDKYLKKDGTIYLVVENRLGLKYFSGSIEEYSYKFFTGLNNFDGYDSIKTLSKKEWESCIEEYNHGFSYKFYHLFPDAIFTNEIHSDEALRNILYGDVYRDVSSAKFNFFNEKQVFKSLKNEGCIDKFTNAFLIELSRDNLSDLYFYSEKECKKTLIEKKENYAITSNIDGVDCKVEICNDTLVRLDDYLIGLADYCTLCNIKESKKVNDFINEFSRILHMIGYQAQEHTSDTFYNKEFIRYFGNSKLKSKVKVCNNLSIKINLNDLYLYNFQESIYIPVSNNSLFIPTNFIIWKYALEWFEANIYPYKSLASKIKFSSLMDIMKISPKEEKIFREWYKNLQTNLNTSEVMYRPTYNKKFVSEIDVALYGELQNDPFQEEDFINNGAYLTEMLEDDKLLDQIRKQEVNNGR